MSELVLFDYDDQPVRTVQINGDPWFVAQDVCTVLGLDNPSKATRGLDDDERGITSVDTPSGVQEMLIISEPGLYSMLVRSRKPEAKRFRRWVTHEVIPTVRRTGQYVAPTTAESSSVPAPRDQFDAMRAMAVAHIAMIDELARQDREIRAVEGHVTQLDQRVTAIESDPGWCAATAWASLRGWLQADRDTLNRLGRRAAKIARAQGLEARKTLSTGGQHSVHRWPLAVWDQAAAELGWQV